jgi:adenylate cyclase class IV
MSPTRFYSNPPRKNIELEVKFFFDHAIEALIRKTAQFVAEKEFQDVYWDQGGYALTTNDIWLRQRSNKWEMKVPVDFQKSVRLCDKKGDLMDQYRELTTPEEIKGFLVENFVPGAQFLSDQPIEEFLRDAHFSTFGTLTTVRRSFTLDGVTIDLDKVAPTNYKLGELEVMAAEEKDIETARAKIYELAKKLNINLSNRIHGKVLHYIRERSPEHWKRLQESSLLRIKGIE